MRNAVFKELYNLAKQDPNTYLMVGDMGFSSVENFARDFKGQFINAGVSEQNMVGVAAGLANQGKKVFIYSLVPFVSLRVLEQLKILVGQQKHNIVVIAAGAGLIYGEQGITHHGVEDLALLNTLPNFKIASPATPLEASKYIRLAHQSSHPYYIRITKTGDEELLPASRIDASIEGLYQDKSYQPLVLKEEGEIALLSFGPILNQVLKLSDMIKMPFRLVHFSHFTDLDIQFVLNEAKKAKVLITVEEHIAAGGFGQLVGNILAEHSPSLKRFPLLKKIAIHKDQLYSIKMGSHKYLQDQLGLSTSRLHESIVSLLK